MSYEMMIGGVAGWVIEMKAADLMNKYFFNNESPGYQIPTEYKHCVDCHTNQTNNYQKGSVYGAKMNCLSCHKTHHTNKKYKP